MAKQAFLTEKTYLDLVGLKALIEKIGDFYKEFQENASANADEIAHLIARADAILSDMDDADLAAIDLAGLMDNATATGLVKEIATYIKALRDELGVYAQPGEAPEGSLAAIDRTAAVVYDRISDLEAIVDNLAPRVKTLEEKSVADVDFEYVRGAEDGTEAALVLTCKNAAGDTLGEVKSVKISDFIVDGMIKSVDLVTATADGKFYTGDHNVDGTPGVATELVLPAGIVGVPDTAWFQTHATHKFIAMIFNTMIENTPGTKLVLIEVENLFNEYDFAGGKDEDGYVEVKLIESLGEHNNVRNVVAEVALSDLIRHDLALVEGEAVREYEADGVTVKSKYRKYEDIDKALEKAEEDIDNLEGAQDALNTTVYGKVDGSDDDYTDDSLLGVRDDHEDRIASAEQYEANLNYALSHEWTAAGAPANNAEGAEEGTKGMIIPAEDVAKLCRVYIFGEAEADVFGPNLPEYMQ